MRSNVRVTKIEVNNDTKIPMIKVRAKPRTEPVPNQNKIPAVIRELALLSRTDVQARLNPSSMEVSKLLPQDNSSLIRSKMRMLASTAIPMDRINPAMPARVRVTGMSLKILREIRM